jgi:hypothetical protein
MSKRVPPKVKSMFYLPFELKNWVRRMAFERGISQSEIVGFALAEYRVKLEKASQKKEHPS